MSSFMVEDKTINTIVAGIKRGALNGPGTTYPGFDQSYLNSLDIPNIDNDYLAKIGGYLFVMNIEAINQRYGEGEAEKFRSLDYKYKSVPAPNTINLYKAIKCLMDQCMEGDVPESTIYKTLEEFSRDIAEHIVHRLPAYEDSIAWA
ncbi:hypothetical protein LCGC14_1984860 [marine sediment metagenome]|uniref:Uncharacterized protein n=1 Tax=marine sediment metagenome TaxID=412755 RepID=A0A0F9F7R3_9ZZZZ